MWFSRKLSRCPACAEPLAILELRDVEIDHCFACRGTWLDAGEIETIAQAAGGSHDTLRDALAGARPVARRSARRCPRCLKKMQTVAVGENNPVEIDRCPQGHGLWFDQGEMRALVAASNQSGGDAVARFFAETFRHEVQSPTQGDAS